MAAPKTASTINSFEIDTVHTPLGDVLVVVADGVLRSLDFEDCRPRMMALLAKRFKTVTLVPAKNPAGISDRVRDYFAGELGALDTVPTDTGGTDFQQQVWQGLRKISPGTVMGYGELACALSRPKAVRAVGMANSLNPIAIALPCHRVVGASGKLTGYAGGLARKLWLLEHEGVAVIDDTVVLPKLAGAPGQDTQHNSEQLSMFA